MTELVKITTEQAIKVMEKYTYIYSDGIQFFTHNGVIYRECGEDKDGSLFKVVTEKQLNDFSFWISKDRSKILFK